MPDSATAARLLSAYKQLEDATAHVEDDVYLTAHLAWVIEELSTVYLDVAGRPVPAGRASENDQPRECSTWLPSDYFLG
jgi:hypothetical protein